MLEVEKARKELAEKSLLDIERATALTWGGRAAACFGLARAGKDAAGRLQRYYEAENYRQEALEHAAMVEDLDFLSQLMEEIEGHRAEARAALGLGRHSPRTAPRGHAAAH